ncbi:hypothetical protein TeGR_g10335, partial [Tetraparma gracilis]
PPPPSSTPRVSSGQSNPGTRATRRPGAYSTAAGRAPGANGSAPGSSPTLYEVRIPPNISGGMTFQIEVSGTRVNVRCPQGMRAGQPLRIQLPSQSPATPAPQAYMVTIPANVRPGSQFRVLVNGTELMVTCPANARPGTNVRIFPPAQVPPPTAPDPTKRMQTFEVEVPAGVSPGQPFQLMANGQKVLVTCPPTARAGQRIRFQLPMAGPGDPGGTTTELAAFKLSYDKDGWSRAVSPSDGKFHWFLNKKDAPDSEESKSGPPKFDFEGFALVRKLDGMNEYGDFDFSSVRLSMEPAQEVPAECRVYKPARPGEQRDRAPLVTHADIASEVGKKFEAKLEW